MPPRSRTHSPKLSLPRCGSEHSSPLRNNAPSYMHAQLSFKDSVVPKTKSEAGKSRVKQGVCPICGVVSTHRKKMLSMEPLTIEGEVLEGWCLKCYTMEFVLTQPGVLDGIEKMRKKGHKKNRRKMGVKSMGDLSGHNIFDDSTHNTVRSAASWEAGRHTNSLPASELEAITDQLDFPTRGFIEIPGELVIPDEVSEVESILEKMKNNPHSSEIQFGCLDLVNLYEKGEEDLFEVIDAVTNAMEKHITNVEIQRTCCQAFRRLSMKQKRGASDEPEINADNCAKMEVVGVIHSVINAMNNHYDSEHVQKEAMCFIRNCLRATGSSKGIILSRNGVEVIVRAMWNLESSSTVQEDGCLILWCLAISNPEAQNIIAFNNGIGAILSSMSKHQSIEKVQYHACGALQTLSSLNLEIQQNMLEIGAYDAILNSMSEHTYSKSVAETASTALNNLLNLALENPLYANVCKMSDRHVQVIVRVMRSNESEARIQKKMCQLLEKGAQSHLNREALQRNENFRYALHEAAANYSAECLDSIINIMNIIDT